MIDRVHQRFVQGEDFFELTADEIHRQSLKHVFAARTAKAMLLTESGYLMLVKSFTDDLAWQVQRELIKSYFRAQPTSNIHFLVPKILPEALRLAADLAEFGEVAA